MGGASREATQIQVSQTRCHPGDSLGAPVLWPVISEGLETTLVPRTPSHEEAVGTVGSGDLAASLTGRWERVSSPYPGRGSPRARGTGRFRASRASQG